MPKKKPKFGADAVNVPGYPSNVRLSPQAAAQVAARQANPIVLRPEDIAYVQRDGQRINLQQNMAQLPSANQPMAQGPLAGLVSPQQQQVPFAPNFNMPQPTPQNTQMPSQYLDPTRNQPADPGFWKNAASFFTAGMAYPNTGIGRRINDALYGSPPTVEAANRFTKFQQDILNLLAQGGLHGITQTPFNFAPIANQQLENFYTQTVPSIAERFTAMGGGQRSSAFQGALANAGRFLGNDLAALQGQYNLQQQGNLLNLLNLGLTPQFEQFVQPGSTGLIPGATNAAVQLGKAAIKAGTFS